MNKGHDQKNKGHEMRRRDRTKSVSAGVFTVVLAYAVFASAWILLSDQTLALLFSEPRTLIRASMVKGWFFVAVTSLLLYFLVRRLVAQLAIAHRRELEYQKEKQQPPPMLVAIVESSDDAIFAKDVEGRYLLFNNAAARFVGKSASEALGSDDHGLFPPDQAAKLLESDRRVRESGKTESNEEVLGAAPRTRVFLTTKGPLRDAQGQIFGTFGISRDITARKQAEIELHESRERLRLLIDHAPTALAMFDRAMRYLEVSQRWREDFSLGNQAILGRSHYEVFPEIPEQWKEVHRRAMSGETVTADEDRFERLDGSSQWLRWEVRPWTDAAGTIGGIVIFSEDITKRKDAEGELTRRNEELERFNRAATDRELRMIELKRQVNGLAQELGHRAPYDLSFTEMPTSGEAR